MEPIVNRVAESALEVFNLEDLWDGKEVVEFDIAPFLYQGLILREKDFRASVKETVWSAFEDKHVAVYCSADAIVPTWAYMLVASRLEPHAASVALGRRADLLRSWYAARLAALDLEKYRDGMIVIKGCGSGIVNDCHQGLRQRHRSARGLRRCATSSAGRCPKNHVRRALFFGPALAPQVVNSDFLSGRSF
jgi:hypothetical protein